MDCVVGALNIALSMIDSYIKKYALKEDCAPVCAIITTYSHLSSSLQFAILIRIFVESLSIFPLEAAPGNPKQPSLISYRVRRDKWTTVLTRSVHYSEYEQKSLTGVSLPALILYD